MTIPGRAWAYGGAVLGVTVSVAANVAHARIPIDPHAGAVAFAALWPLFLFVTIEIMARTPWPDLARWRLVRFGGLSVVAVVAAVVSYRHQSGLLAFYGEDGLTSVIGPLAVDGLLLTATGALIATSGTVHRAELPAMELGPVAVAAPAVEAVTPDPAHDPDATPVTPARPDLPRAPRRKPDGRVTPDQSRAYVTAHPDQSRDQQAAALGLSARTLTRHLQQPALHSVKGA